VSALAGSETLTRRRPSDGVASSAWRTNLVRTDNDGVLALHRVVLGAVVLAHGLQKVIGWFGGGGITATVDFFQNVLHLPAAVAVFVMLSDFVGALALLAGAFTRVAALGTALVMLGAIATVHASNGFFMNWFGNQAGEGFEFHLLALALSTALVLHGGGRASLDRWRYLRTAEAYR
jgi:putative oxidoreductase